MSASPPSIARQQPARAARRSLRETWLDRGWLYRQSRMLHAYLSAFAFITLMFFSVTGLLLNHAEWFEGTKDAGRDSRITLSAETLAAARKSSEPGRVLAAAVAEQVALRGGYKTAEVLDDEAQIRLDGVSGRSDLVIDLKTGTAEISVKRASVVSLIGDLHRGKNSGAAWAWLIDISAVLVLALSLFGYLLFFSMKFRLGTSLKLTAASLLAMLAVFWLCVP